MTRKTYFFAPILLALALFAGCSTLTSTDAKVTFSEPHVLTTEGLVAQSDLTPGTYSQNQVVDAGTYLLADLEKVTPVRSLPDTATIEPGNNPSPLEAILLSVGGFANSAPGGQPLAALLLGAGAIAQIWRDKRTIRNTNAAAKTLGGVLDLAYDIAATLPPTQAAKFTADLDKGIDHFKKVYTDGREILDAVVAETETPNKTPIETS